MKDVARGLGIAILALCMASAARPALGTDTMDGAYFYEILLDTDNDTSTGGPVPVIQGTEPAPHDVVGIDYIVRVHTGLGPTLVFGPQLATTLPNVVARDVLKWNPNTTSFEQTVCDNSMYPTGTDGAGHELIEFGAPLSLLGGDISGARGVFHASISSSGANDYTPSFIIVGPLRSPALSHAPLALLGLLLFGCALWALRRRGWVAARTALVILLSAGAVWAAGIVLDGDFSDWAGLTPVVTDPAGDSSIGDPAEDILAGYVTQQGGNAFFRVDVAAPPQPI